MANPSINHQIFYDKAIQLVESLVIKCNDSTSAMNNYLITVLGQNSVNLLDPTSWRTHMHLAGEYHSIDKLMYVKSMDTLETILFSKENLKYHRATAKYYAIGQRGYIELVGKYPMQEILIKGILNPVPMTDVVNTKDYTILTYNKSLIEVNEYSLIMKLQNWIDGFVTRWYNVQYNITDELYLASFLSVMYAQLVGAVVRLRMEACRTNEAHSYHVKNFLVSNGIKEKYVDYLTTKQLLYLYKELPYLRRNLGKDEVFKELVDVVLTERDIPLDDFIMVHNLETQLETLYPKVHFKRMPLNNVGGVGKNILSLPEILKKENALAPGNEVVNEESLHTITEQMENSLSSELTTKLLESAMLDRTESQQYNFSSTLLEHWLWMVHNKLYNSIVTVQNPRTGEYIPLTSKDAFILMAYTYYKALGKELITVPNFAVIRSPFLVAKTKAELMAVVDKKYVKSDIAEALILSLPKIENVISIEAFRNQAHELFLAYQAQQLILDKQGNYIKHGYVQAMVEMLYTRESFYLVPETTTYKEWLVEKNLDLAHFSPSEFDLLTTAILKEGTGANLDTSTSLAALQKALLSLLQDLSSYTIQLVGEINEYPLKPIELQTVVPGDLDLLPHARIQGVEVYLDSVIKRLKPKDAFFHDNNEGLNHAVTILRVGNVIHLDETVEATTSHSPMVSHYHLDTCDFDFNSQFISQ